MIEMMEGFSWRLSDLTARVDSTHEAAANGGTSTEVPPLPSTSRALDWADRPLDQPLDTLPPIQWPDKETKTSGKLVEVSEETTTFLRSCFGKPLTNAARHSLKKPIGIPKVDATKCPKLNRVVKGSVSKDTKEANSTLAKLQTLLLDAVAPLVHVLETTQSGNLTIDTSVKDLNKDLLMLVEDDEIFADVAPMLFGDGFEKMMKEQVEAMRCIRKTSNKTTESFFRRGRPQGQYHQHYRGGGNSHRGRGWYHPYRGNNYSNHSAGKENFRRKNQPQQ